MNLIPGKQIELIIVIHYNKKLNILLNRKVIGPFNIKVYGYEKGFLNRPVEFMIKNENVIIEEVIIIGMINILRFFSA